MTAKQLICTLVYPLTADGRVLLAKKKRKVSIGMWNGWGGKVDPTDPSVRAAAARELYEESGLITDPAALQYRGHVTFHNDVEDMLEVVVHVFVATQWSGDITVKEDEATEPTWWSIDSLPFDTMTASDRDWLPQVLGLAGPMIEAEVWNGPDQRTLLRPTEVRTRY